LQDPAHNLFVSMVDAKLPVHYWLLALARPLGGDPVTIGRLVSVLIGALAIPLLFGLCGELDRLTPATTRGRGQLLATVASLLLIVCPYFAFYQRMALAESLLMTESLALAWLALRLARLITAETPLRTQMFAALCLGLAWAVTLLTKQNYSYLLWSLPVLAVVANMRRENAWRMMRRFVPLIGLATVIGLVFFIPALFTDDTYDLKTRLIYKTYFYQATTFSRWDLAMGNLRKLLFPGIGGRFAAWPADPERPLETGILYTYLTPPLLLLALAGAVGMVKKNAARALLFCGLWMLALAVPQIIVSGTFNSRYNVVGALPWILPAAWLLVFLLSGAREGRRWIPAVGMLILIACLAWPATSTMAELHDWHGGTFTAQDREEYFSSSGSGAAAEQAIAWLQSEMAAHPVTLVTRSSFGVQNDLAWLELQRSPNLSMVASNTDPPLQILHGEPYTYHVNTEPWLIKHVADVALPQQRKAWFLGEVAYDPHRDATYFVPPLEKIAPDARVVRVFMNPSKTPDEPAKCGVVVAEFSLPAEPGVAAAH
jgi:hypothetical protein